MAEILETTRMSTRGQVIIPMKTREFTRSEENTLFTVTPLDKDTILLKKMDTHRLLADFRKIRASVKNRMTENEVNELVHRVRHEMANRDRR